jgi:hypothetical protein
VKLAHRAGTSYCLVICRSANCESESPGDKLNRDKQRHSGGVVPPSAGTEAQSRGEIFLIVLGLPFLVMGVMIPFDNSVWQAIAAMFAAAAVLIAGGVDFLRRRWMRVFLYELVSASSVGGAGAR